MRRWRALALAAAAALLAAACSLVQLGYSQLDRIVYWYVDDYLPLNGEQGAALRQRIARLVQWHCSTQMPAYGAWLRAVQADVLAGAAAPQFDRRADEALGFLREIAAAAAPDAADLLAQASPQQIAALFEAIDKRNREFREDWVEAAPRSIARKREKRLRGRIESWIGPLNPAQEQALAAWTRDFQPTGPGWLESRLRWQAALRQAVERRTAGADFRAEIHALFVHPETHWSPDYLRRAQANRQRSLEMLAAVAVALDETQRARLEREVSATAGDFSKLACTGEAPKLGALPEGLATG